MQFEGKMKSYSLLKFAWKCVSQTPPKRKEKIRNEKKEIRKRNKSISKPNKCKRSIYNKQCMMVKHGV